MYLSERELSKSWEAIILPPPQTSPTLTPTLLHCTAHDSPPPEIFTSFSLLPRSTAAVRSHHVAASENYNHHNNNHSALGCGQHYHHNRAQGGQQGSAQATSRNPTDYFPSAPGVFPFT